MFETSSLKFEALLKSVSHAATDTHAQVEVRIDVLTGLSYELTQFSKSAWMTTEHSLLRRPRKRNPTASNLVIEETTQYFCVAQSTSQGTLHPKIHVQESHNEVGPCLAGITFDQNWAWPAS